MPDPVTVQLVRGSILAAAMKVFSQRGIAAVRVEDLLVAAKMARRTFYKYFRSKEDVLAALYEVSTAELVKAMEAARAREPDAPLAGVHRGIDIYLDFHEDRPRALRELLELALRSDSLLAPRRAWMQGELVRILDEAVQELDGRRLDPLLYRALLGALEGLSMHLLDAAGGAAALARGRAVLHALVDQVLGAPDPRPLPQAPTARARR